MISKGYPYTMLTPPRSPGLSNKACYTFLCTVLAWFGSFLCSIFIAQGFPDFDGAPLLAILMAAMVFFCIVNRTAARIYARNHFGMPPEERRALLESHARDVRSDPKAAMAKFDGMGTVPIFLLILYFALTFAMGSLWLPCLFEETVWRIGAGIPPAWRWHGGRTGSPRRGYRKRFRG